MHIISTNQLATVTIIIIYLYTMFHTSKQATKKHAYGACTGCQYTYMYSYST